MEKLFTILIGALLLASPAAGADDSLEAAKLLRAGRYQLALAQVDAVLASRPRDPRARMLKGQILSEQGRAKEAIATFKKLTEEYPEIPEPYHRLALLYSAEGQYEKSRAVLHKSFLALSTARHGADFDAPRSGSTQ